MNYIVRTRFNPYHDPANGQFTSADHAVDSPEHLMSYMKTLAKGGYHPNIMNMTVAGKPIFNPDKSLGLRRDQMPQIPTAARDEFLQQVGSHEVEMDPRTLNPTQDQLDGHKTAKFMLQSMEGTDRFRSPIVSRDGYIIDGHHNWASRVVQAVANPSANVMMPAHLVDMSRDDLLAAAHKFADAHGFESKPIYKAGPYRIKLKFNPNHDPSNGEFASGGQGLADGAASFPYHALEVATDPDQLDKLHQKLVGIATNYRDMKLNGQQQDALSNYQSSSFAQMNAAASVVGEEPLMDLPTVNDYKPVNEAVDAVNARPDEKYTDGYMTPSDAYENAQRLESALNNAPTIPDNLTVYRVFRNNDFAAQASDAMVGNKYVDSRFISTTLDGSKAANWGEERLGDPGLVVMKLKTEDAKGLYLSAGPGSSTPWEYEILFNRLTPVTITGVTPIKEGGVLVEGTIGHNR